MKHTILIATLLITLAGCSSTAPVAFMRGSDVAAADQAPDTKQYSERAPGTGSPELIKRTFSTQPPLIPHAIEKYLPITLDENDCMDCHITDEFKGKKMPRMGDSHFSKTRKEEDGTPAVNMVRWQCVTCHVVQADAKPLVENTFVGNVAK
ncbi:MAG: nitrate reductase cytochrome c-type subunit [Rhodocyclaceae bacterium]|nr:nitrate reductase cytochrome c-type subunit [Rhodocyclaceae bacterium]